MGATIDNLESHHSYRVIRGFADANGVHVPFDAVGVIRHIDISDDWTQIIIDWEQDGKTLQLVFAMNATDGPRNNHMRTYFEKGELSLPPRPAKPKPQTPPAPEPAAAPPVEQAVASELARVKQMLDTVGDALTEDMDILMRHERAMQNFDIAAQIIAELAEVLAADDREAAVGAVHMHDLRSRLSGRLTLT